MVGGKLAKQILLSSGPVTLLSDFACSLQNWLNKWIKNNNGNSQV